MTTSARTDHTEEIRGLHALGRSDEFIAGAIGLTVGGVVTARRKLGLQANPIKQSTDAEVAQRPPKRLEWEQRRDTPDGVQWLLREARRAFLEDNGLMVEIAEDAAKAAHK